MPRRLLSFVKVPALMGNPVDSQYAPTTHQIQPPHNGGHLGDTGTLPFTGAELGLLAAVGIALTTSGILLRLRRR